MMVFTSSTLSTRRAMPPAALISSTAIWTPLATALP